jgi:hypothetical protein
MRGPYHDAIITESGDAIANVNRKRRETTVSVNAAEIVRRWNAHEQLVQAAEIAGYKLEQSHSKCDIAQDTDCYAEQYGDGNASEHEDFRNVNAALDAAEGGE